MDADGYPTEVELEEIEKCTDPTELWQLVASVWSSYGSITHELREMEKPLVKPPNNRPIRYVRLATGGWSGNESIIHALNKNHYARWLLSARGGLHIYEYEGR